MTSPQLLQGEEEDGTDGLRFQEWKEPGPLLCKYTMFQSIAFNLTLIKKTPLLFTAGNKRGFLPFQLFSSAPLFSMKQLNKFQSKLEYLLINWRVTLQCSPDLSLSRAGAQQQSAIKLYVQSHSASLYTHFHCLILTSPSLLS